MLTVVRDEIELIDGKKAIVVHAKEEWLVTLELSQKSMEDDSLERNLKL